MIKKLISPVYLLPLMLVSPYIYIGLYGMTFVEALVILAFFALVVPALLKDSFRLPKFLLIYLALFLFGSLAAVINGLNWGIPVGLWNLNIFYKIALAIGSYYIGYQLYQSIDTVITRRFFYAVIISLAVVAALYPFLTFEQRFALLKVFYSSGDLRMIELLMSSRFPGLGINSVIYSFMVFIFLLFSFDAYLRKLTPGIFPLLAFIVIFVGASKLVIGLSVIACCLLLLNKVLSFKTQGIIGHGAGNTLFINKRAMFILSLIFVFIFGISIYLTQTSTGKVMVETISTFNRISKSVNDSGDHAFGVRFGAWERGLDRVKLAPILGIVKDRFSLDDLDTLSYKTPHNEFIEQWMFYGVTGMFAYIFLLGALIIANLRKKAELVWPLLYLAMIIEMLFDSVFEAVRSYALIFIIIGINMRYLKQKQSTNIRCQVKL